MFVNDNSEFFSVFIDLLFMNLTFTILYGWPILCATVLAFVLRYCFIDKEQTEVLVKLVWI